jgi:AraC-like DNA-binding protein/ActR/RegA family two-component response regulator
MIRGRNSPKEVGLSQIKLLWVDVDAGDPKEASRELFERLFEVIGVSRFEFIATDSAAAGDVICFNFDYPAMSGLKLIPEAKRRWPSSPILLLTQQNSCELSLWALRSRVFDLLVKPAQTGEVNRTFERIAAAVQARRCQTERKPQGLTTQLPAETRYRPQAAVALRLQAAIAHIAKNFLRPIPESEVALLCNMSPSRFCREFKAAFQVTFVEYLANYRMEQAKRLLGNPSMPVADVAAAVGFNDPSYFTRVFRRQEGVSPSEYRAATVLEPIRARTAGGH